MTRCDVLEWDSAFFECAIARYRPACCAGADLDALAAECAARGIACVYLLIDSRDTRSVEALTGAGAFFADVRLTFETRVHADAGGSLHLPGVRVRNATAPDLPALTRLAGISHRLTRFYADPRFPDDRCDRFYETWIENSCRGYADAVLVAEADHAALGYVTCHLDADGHGHIGLFAVAPDWQGRGIGRSLMAGARAWFADSGVTTMTVATQLRNLRAIRLYERSGFTLSQAAFWFHHWSASAR